MMSIPKKYFLPFLLSLGCFLATANVMVAQEESLELTEAERAYLKAKGKLTIVCDPSWPPYEYMNEKGVYEGISIDYHHLLARRIGIPIEQIPTSSWPESLELAQKGKCDLVSTLNKTPLRSRYLDFTDPFFNAKVVIIGKKDSGARTLNSYTGQVMAVVKGYKMEEDLARDYPAISHYRVATTEASLRAVAENKAEATLASFIEADHIIRVNNLDTLKILGETRYDNHYRLGVRKGDLFLQSIMQKAVRSLTPEDKRLIEERWITTPDNASPGLPAYTLPLSMGLLGLCLLAAWLAGGRKRSPSQE